MSEASDATFEYLTGQLRDGHPALLAAFQHASDKAVAALQPLLDVPYGPHGRERFDLFTAARPWRGTAAFFHAGYWQSRDKSQFRFLARRCLGHGIDLALINYPLCPDVTVAELVTSTRRAVPAVLRHVRDVGRGGSRLVALGHSAGAHIAAELALTDWREHGLADSPIAAVGGLSGVYELEPLRHTPLNDKLRLDAMAAHAASPLRRLRRGLPPALFAVGAGETKAFLAQTESMAQAWKAAGNTADALVVDHADHFTLLESDRLWQSLVSLCHQG